MPEDTPIEAVSTDAAPPKSGGARMFAAAMPGLFVFLWSTGFIGAKFGLPYAEPFTFLTVRFAIVATLLFALSLAVRAPWPRDPATIAHLAVAGLLVHGAYLGGVFSAIAAGLSAGVTALVTGLQPALTAIVAGPLLGERVSRVQWAGVVLGFAGIALVVARKLSLTLDDWTGLVLAFVAVIGITAGTLYQKRFCGTMDLRTGSVVQFSAAFAALAFLAVMFEPLEIRWTGSFIFALGWLVVVLSLGAITLLYLLIRRGAAAKVASLFYLVPPVTALISYFVFDEVLGALEIAGMAAVVLGVALVIRSAPAP